MLLHRLILSLVAAVLFGDELVLADIYRWDNGELIDRPTVTIADQFSVDERATLVLGARCSFGCPVSSHLVLRPAVEVSLKGTLRVVGRVYEPVSFRLFDWGQTLEADDRFGSLELPAGEWDVSRLYDLGETKLTSVYRLNGDFNVDGVADIADLDRLALAIRAGHDPSYDVNRGDQLNHIDLADWIHGFARTTSGDANLDTVFTNDDLVAVFTAGQFEDEIVGNSTWATGDWNGDAEFTNDDLVLAFLDGGYNREPRTEVKAVPESAAYAPLATAVLCGLAVNRRTRRPLTKVDRDFRQGPATHRRAG